MSSTTRIPIMSNGVLGFTGTRKGLTNSQLIALRGLLETKRWRTFVHGDCLGSDIEAHAIALSLGMDIVKRPCDLPLQRAYAPGGVALAPEPPLARNKKIVDSCWLLCACPSSTKESRRSGTWATVRYARSQGKSIILIWPDGSATRENS